MHFAFKKHTNHEAIGVLEYQFQFKKTGMGQIIKNCARIVYLISFALFFIFLPSIPAHAQYAEIGFSLGGTHYTGDLVRSFRPSTVRPGASVFYRQNFSEAVSGKISLSGDFLHGDDANPIDAFAEMRAASFSNFLLQADASIEYHFLDYKSEAALVNFSPYLSLGIGLFFFTGADNPYNSYSKIQPVLPIGLGFKYLISPRVTLGIEYNARKTFFDYLDNISSADVRLKNYAYGDWYDNDWHYYLGFSFSYAFYDIPCPYNWK